MALKKCVFLVERPYGNDLKVTITQYRGRALRLDAECGNRQWTFYGRRKNDLVRALHRVLNDVGVAGL